MNNKSVLYVGIFGCLFGVSFLVVGILKPDTILTILGMTLLISSPILVVEVLEDEGN